VDLHLFGVDELQAGLAQPGEDAGGHPGAVTT
jgi:hypothetical protein